MVTRIFADPGLSGLYRDRDRSIRNAHSNHNYRLNTWKFRVIFEEKER